MIKTLEKISYGIGYWGNGLLWTLNGLYLTLYMTDVIYIDPAIVGLILLIPNILDVFTDFLFISWADKHPTKIGRYRPWILTGIPCAVLMYLYYMVPGFIKTPNQVIIWFSLIALLLIPGTTTMYSCAYLTMGAVISPDRDDKVSLVSYSNIFTQLANIVVIGSMMSLLERFGSSELGYRDPQAWRKAVMLYAAVSLLTSLICFFGTKERVRIEECDGASVNISLKDKLKTLFSSKPCLKALLINSLNVMVLYSYSAALSYICIYRFGHEEWITSISLIGVAFSFLMVVLCSALQKKFSKKSLLTFSAILHIVSGIYFMFVNNYVSLVIFVILKNISCICIAILTEVYTSFSVDYIQKNTGISMPGFIKGMLSAFQKIFCTIGVYLVSIFLVIGKYDATKTVQDKWTIDCIDYGIAILFMIVGLSIFFMNRKLDEFSD